MFQEAPEVLQETLRVLQETPGVLQEAPRVLQGVPGDSWGAPEGPGEVLPSATAESNCVSRKRGKIPIPLPANEILFRNRVFESDTHPRP